MSTPTPATRGPIRALLDDWVFQKKVPAGCGFLRALGTALAILLATQAVTGMLLALCYVPSPDHAYDSIRYIDEDVGHGAGRLVRGLHHWGASSIIVLAFLHLLRVYFTGAYKRPRGLLWVVGVALFGILLGFGFTGYLLPWDLKGFWATDVGINIVASLPRIGPKLADLLRGGPEIGAPTLTRLFALHVLALPAVLVPLAWLHLFLVHKLGITPPGARVGEPEVKSAPFFPDHVFKELLVAAVALAVVLGLAWFLGAPLEEAADRDAQGYEPRPEWYFVGLFQLLKYFEGDRVIIATAVIPGGLGLVLLLLPWIDRSKERAPARRPFAIAAASILLATLGGLTILGLKDKGTHRPAKPRIPVGDGSYVPPNSPPINPPDGTTPANPVNPANGHNDPSTKPDTAADPDSPRAKLLAEGRKLVDTFECLGCHTLGGEGNTTGSDAPAFEKVAPEHDAAYFEKFILDPKAFKPDIDMPSATYLEMSDADRAKLAAWLVALAGK